MKRTIIFEFDWRKDNYIEWDFVLMRPKSDEVYQKDLLERDWPRDPERYYYNDTPQQPLIDLWERMYWDKYMLGRIQYVTEAYGWKLRACVDFAYLTQHNCWRTWKPFGWRYNYFDALHVDMIKAFNNLKCPTYLDWKDFRDKAEQAKVLGWVPTNKIVMHRGAATRRADMSNQTQESICDTAEGRWKERHNLTSTPTEEIEI